MSITKLPLVAIVGRPNVGKSSLFNKLLHRRRAIVDDAEGTTRDTVQAQFHHEGRGFWLVDTAGMHEPGSELEEDVQSQVTEAIDLAECIIVVVSGDVIPGERDRRVAKLALKSKKPVILAVNKIDRHHNVVAEEWRKLGIKHIVGTSAIHGTGLGDLVDIMAAETPTVTQPSDDKPLTIALLGRPNVGKSSLFNRLLAQQRAVVNVEPGTTRDVNDGYIAMHKQRIRILDTAGVRQSAKQSRGIEHFSLLRTVQAINEADVCIVVIDAGEPATKLDQKVAGMVKEAGKGMILALNKWDIIRDSAYQVNETLAEVTRAFQFCWWAPVVYTSADSGHNVFKIIELSSEIQTRREQEYSTTQMNTILQDSMMKHAPSGLKNRHPRLKYVTQTGTAPPQFTLFGRHISFLHWSYKRYLERAIRDELDFTGTAVVLDFRDPDEKVQLRGHRIVRVPESKRGLARSEAKTIKKKSDTKDILKDILKDGSTPKV